MYTAIDVVEKFSIYHLSWIILFVDANKISFVRLSFIKWLWYDENKETSYFNRLISLSINWF